MTWFDGEYFIKESGIQVDSQLYTWQISVSILFPSIALLLFSLLVKIFCFSLHFICLHISLHSIWFCDFLFMTCSCHWFEMWSWDLPRHENQEELTLFSLLIVL